MALKHLPLSKKKKSWLHPLQPRSSDTSGAIPQSERINQNVFLFSFFFHHTLSRKFNHIPLICHKDRIRAESRFGERRRDRAEQKGGDEEKRGGEGWDETDGKAEREKESTRTESKRKGRYRGTKWKNKATSALVSPPYDSITALGFDITETSRRVLLVYCGDLARQHRWAPARLTVVLCGLRQGQEGVEALLRDTLAVWSGPCGSPHLLPVWHKPAKKRARSAKGNHRPLIVQLFWLSLIVISHYTVKRC